MLRRKLRLLVVDDSMLSESAPALIELVEMGGQERVAAWADHCNSLAFEKALDYDLLSIDILFDRDGTDPGVAFLPEAALQRVRGYNCAGLYHGMMALARRNPSDRHGNRLPVAWEIRSVNARELDHPELKTEAVRAYGLLRSFLARPREEEALAQCLLREGHEEEPPRSFSPGRSIQETFLEDLRSLPAVKGSGIGITARLLGQWRSRTRVAVEVGDLSLDTTALRGQTLQLARATDEQARDLVQELYLPVAGWRREAEYGIALESVFADLLPAFSEDWAKLIGKSEDTWVTRAVSWLEELGIAAGPAQSEDDLMRIARFAHDVTGAKPGQMAEWWRAARPLDRCFVYCVLQVRSRVLPHRYPEQTDDTLAVELGLDYTQKTFLAPFKKSRFGDCETASEFKNELRRSLLGNGALLRVRWLRVVLRRFCQEVLLVPEAKLREVAPGLLE